MKINLNYSGYLYFYINDYVKKIDFKRKGEIIKYKESRYFYLIEPFVVAIQTIIPFNYGVIEIYGYSKIKTFTFSIKYKNKIETHTKIISDHNLSKLFTIREKYKKPEIHLDFIEIILPKGIYISDIIITPQIIINKNG